MLKKGNVFTGCNMSIPEAFPKKPPIAAGCRP